MIKQRQKGNITISTVIVTSSILLVAGAALLLSMSDFSRSSNAYLNNKMNELQIKTCVEEVLRKLKTDMNYSGSYNIPSSQGSCDATVSANGNFRDITIESTYNDYKTSTTRKVDVSTNPYILTNE